MKITPFILILFLNLNTSQRIFSSSYDWDHFQQTVQSESVVTEIDQLIEQASEESDLSEDTKRTVATEALKLARQIGAESKQAHALFHLGMIEFNALANEAALAYFEEALSIFDSLNETERVPETLFRLGSLHIRLYDTTKAMEPLRRALNMHRDAGDDKELSRVHARMAYGFWRCSEYDSALVHYQHTLAIREKMGDLNMIALSLNSIGVLYWNWAKYEKALEYYLRSLKTREKMGDQRNIARVLCNIGKVYLIQDEVEKAHQAFRNALVAGQTSDDTESEAYALNNMGIAFETKGQADSARIYYQRSIDVYRLTDHLGGVSMNLEMLGVLDNKTGYYARALRYLNQALANTEEIKNNMRKSSVLKNLGQVYIHRHEFGKALEIINDCLITSKEIGQNERVMECYRLRSEAYTGLFQFEEALIAFQNYESIKDSLFSADQGRQLAELRTQYETEKAETENQTLRMENQIQEGVLNRQRTIIIAIILGFILTVVFVLIQVRTNRQLTRSKNQVEMKSQQLEASNAAKDKFFSIIAHDLRHPFNTIASFIRLMGEKGSSYTQKDMQIYIQQLKENADTTYILLENLLQWSRTQTGRIDFQAQSFHISTLIEKNITSFDYMAQTKNIKIITEFNDSDLVFADSNMVNSILHNLLSNALKFTDNGGVISVTTSKSDSSVKTEITDSGVGISDKNISRLFQIGERSSTSGTADERGSGLGLILCKEFIDMHEGTIYVKSVQGKGTTVSFTLPIPK